MSRNANFALYLLNNYISLLVNINRYLSKKESCGDVSILSVLEQLQSLICLSLAICYLNLAFACNHYLFK